MRSVWLLMVAWASASPVPAPDSVPAPLDELAPRCPLVPSAQRTWDREASGSDGEAVGGTLTVTVRRMGPEAVEASVGVRLDTLRADPVMARLVRTLAEQLPALDVRFERSSGALTVVDADALASAWEAAGATTLEGLRAEGAPPSLAPVVEALVAEPAVAEQLLLGGLDALLALHCAPVGTRVVGQATTIAHPFGGGELPATRSQTASLRPGIELVRTDVADEGPLREAVSGALQALAAGLDADPVAKAQALQLLADVPVHASVRTEAAFDTAGWVQAMTVTRTLSAPGQQRTTQTRFEARD